MTTTREQCGTCHFYRMQACHRFPPAQAVGSDIGTWPSALPGSWCGEWRERVKTRWAGTCCICGRSYYHPSESVDVVPDCVFCPGCQADRQTTGSPPAGVINWRRSA